MNVEYSHFFVLFRESAGQKSRKQFEGNGQKKLHKRHNDKHHEWDKAEQIRCRSDQLQNNISLIPAFVQFVLSL